MRIIQQPLPSLCVWASGIGVQLKKPVARPALAFFAQKDGPKDERATTAVLPEKSSFCAEMVRATLRATNVWWTLPCCTLIIPYRGMSVQTAPRLNIRSSLPAAKLTTSQADLKTRDRKRHFTDHTDSVNGVAV